MAQNLVRCLAPVSLALAALLPLPVAAQDDKPVDIEGSKDHPAVKR